MIVALPGLFSYFFFHVKTGTRFSVRNKRLFDIGEVKITGVDNINIICPYMYM